MKKIAFFAAAVLMLSLTACSSDKDGFDETDEEEDNQEWPMDTYRGTLIVDQNDGTVYIQKNVVLHVTVQQGSVEIEMKNVGFSDRMPVKLNMTIPGLSASAAYGGYRLTGENIIPHALGGEYEMYTITGFTGNISELKKAGIQFEMMCGTYPTSFTGKRIDK